MILFLNKNSLLLLIIKHIFLWEISIWKLFLFRHLCVIKIIFHFYFFFYIHNIYGQLLNEEKIMKIKFIVVICQTFFILFRVSFFKIFFCFSEIIIFILFTWIGWLLFFVEQFNMHVLCQVLWLQSALKRPQGIFIIATMWCDGKGKTFLIFFFISSCNCLLLCIKCIVVVW